MAATSYEIKFSDTTKNPDSITVLGTSVGTGKNNYDTSLDLIGPGYVGYGQAYAQNFLKLLENFASPYPPINAIEGQIWYDTSNPDRKVLRVNNGSVTNSRWPSANGIYQQSNDPAVEFVGNITEGDIWVDTSSNQLKIRYSDAWTLVGPPTSVTSNKTGPESVILESTTGTNYPVILNYSDGRVIEIISANSFVPKSVIDGFTQVKAGVSLTSRLGSKYYGTAEKANSLVLSNGNLIGAGDVLKNRSTTVPQTHTGTFVVESSNGLYVRNATFNQDVRVYNTGSGAFVNYSDSTKSFKVGVNNDSYIQFSPSYSSVGINKSPTSGSATLDVNGDADFLGTVTIATPNLVALNVLGGAAFGNSVTFSKSISVTSSSSFTHLLTLGTTGGSGTLIASVTTSTYDIGSQIKPFRTVYAKYVGDSATSSTNFYGTFHGVIANDARLSNRNFKLQGQVTATTQIFNATADVVFTATLTSSAIEGQTALTTASSTATLLVNNAGLKQITKANFLQDVYPGLVLPGMMVAYGGASAPSGFLICDGTTYSQTTYASLYSVIGTTYGSGAPGTFKVPNMTTATNAAGVTVNYIIKT